MVSARFSLADATDAKVDFWYRNKSESGYDYLWWMASIDNLNFYGSGVSGDQNSWRSQSFDLKTSIRWATFAARARSGWPSFSSNVSNTDIGAFVDDIVISRTPTGTPDLTPYQPANWNDKIPVGITQLAGTAAHTYTGSFFDNQPLYFNWASTNIGTASALNYTVHCEVTGTGGGAWDWPGISTDPGYFTYLTNDQAVGPLSAGTHTFKFWTDYTGVVAESNESNNYYERTITVLSSALPDLAAVDLYPALTTNVTTPLATVTAGQSVALVFKYTYAGTVPSGSTTNRIQLDNDTARDWTGTLSPRAPGTSATPGPPRPETTGSAAGAT